MRQSPPGEPDYAFGQAMLTLPKQGQVQAHIEGGIGNTTIRIPAGVAARITLDAGIGNVEIVSGEPPKTRASISISACFSAPRVGS